MSLVSNFLSYKEKDREQIEILFSRDVETKGKKQGYDKAAKEYDSAYKKIAKEFKAAMEYFNEKKSELDQTSDDKIQMLEDFEKEKARLQKQVEQKSKAVSQKYNIPESSLKASMAAGTLLISGPATLWEII